jgi:uncharacterized protein YjbI with pentapeptide repeats
LYYNKLITLQIIGHSGFHKCNYIMKKSSLILILPQILMSHKEWFESKGEQGIFADLSEEDLRESYFKNAVLVEANFQGADLRGANFENADLRGANLQDAQLNNATLKNANFEETDMMWANLENASLQNTSLDGAYLHGANLKNTKITTPQIQFSYTDEDTLLPPGIQSSKL